MNAKPKLSPSAGKIHVILPAGGRLSPKFAESTGIAVKALLLVDGQTLLRRVVTALRSIQLIGELVVIGPEEVQAEGRRCGVEGIVTEGTTGPENILRGIEWLQTHCLGSSDRLLIVTTDLPFLTGAAVQHFLEATSPESDISGALLTRQQFLERFPDGRDAFVHLRDGEFTFGSVFLARPEALLMNVRHLENAFAARKSPWVMASLIGAPTLWRLLTRQLTVQEVEERISALVHCRAVAVRAAPPELAFDIDSQAEYEYARRLLEGTAAPEITVAG